MEQMLISKIREAGGEVGFHLTSGVRISGTVDVAHESCVDVKVLPAPQNSADYAGRTVRIAFNAILAVDYVSKPNTAA